MAQPCLLHRTRLISFWKNSTNTQNYQNQQADQVDRLDIDMTKNRFWSEKEYSKQIPGKNMCVHGDMNLHIAYWSHHLDECLQLFELDSLNSRNSKEMSNSRRKGRPQSSWVHNKVRWATTFVWEDSLEHGHAIRLIELYSCLCIISACSLWIANRFICLSVALHH